MLGRNLRLGFLNGLELAGDGPGTFWWQSGRLQLKPARTGKPIFPRQFFESLLHQGLTLVGYFSRCR